jgi:hypothetical protein
MSERSLRSYLLLPRPGDLVKAWVFPASYLFGVLAAGGAGGRELLRAAVIWLALELLIYQARYQWNDIRGFAADQRHPDRASRGRLPGPISHGRSHIRASALVATGRLALAAILAVALPLDLGGTLSALVVAVFAVAFLYEALRARSTGGSEQVPPPLTAGIIALWLVVGAGYAIRGLAGLAAAVPLFQDPWLPLAAGIAFWAFGIAFVTSRWALEALPFGRREGDGRISWRVEPGQAREHSLALVRWLPASAPGGERGDTSLRAWRALRARVSPLAPWNLAVLLAATAAAAGGRLLAGPADGVEVALAALAGATFAVGALAPRRLKLAGLLSGALGLVLVMAAAGSPRPALVLLPWLSVLGAHLFFTAQSPRTLTHPLRSALAGAWARQSERRPQRLPFASLPRR